MIYRYFGSLNYLIESYVVDNNYWMVFANKMNEMMTDQSFAGSKQLNTAVLQNQFKYFISEKDMQRSILWELSTESPLMKRINNVR